MRMIDGDALEEFLSDAEIEATKQKRYVFASALNVIQGNVRNFPTIEPEPKKGRWIPVDSYSAYGGDEAAWMAHGNPIAYYYCSNCKGQARAGENGESLLTDFCPDCGSYNGDY